MQKIKLKYKIDLVMKDAKRDIVERSPNRATNVSSRISAGKQKNVFSTLHNYFIILIIIPLLFSCKDELVAYQDNDCKAQAPFIKKLGYNPARSAFSTSEKIIKGLVLLQINENGDTSGGGRKLYQHPSWASAGWLGPMQIAPNGHVFLAPVPVINLIDNPPSKQNIIYKVDATSGIMSAFVNLPITADSTVANPYGLLGFAYLCESNTLYASTVQGSTRQQELGILYAIDASSGKILDKVKNIDVLGMGISYTTGQRKLYFGSARNSSVYEITLKENGTFATAPSVAFNIENLGPRGDDKVRRIKFNKATGQMNVYGLEFNFNLTAPTEKQENMYVYNYDEELKKWVVAY